MKQNKEGIKEKIYLLANTYMMSDEVEDLMELVEQLERCKE